MGASVVLKRSLSSSAEAATTPTVVSVGPYSFTIVQPGASFFTSWVNSHVSGSPPTTRVRHGNVAWGGKERHSASRWLGTILMQSTDVFRKYSARTVMSLEPAGGIT